MRTFYQTPPILSRVKEKPQYLEILGLVFTLKSSWTSPPLEIACSGSCRLLRPTSRRTSSRFALRKAGVPADQGMTLTLPARRQVWGYVLMLLIPKSYREHTGYGDYLLAASAWTMALTSASLLSLRVFSPRILAFSTRMVFDRSMNDAIL